MHVESQINGNAFKVAISDQLTFSDHKAFRVLLDEVKKSGAQKCVFDLSKLAAVDCAGLGMFVVALQESKKVAGR
jgi:HptB-dependent secretion and biofilm anti anti-sigma factor